MDTIDSPIKYYYEKPKHDSDLLGCMIPFVNLGLYRQKLYIIPDRPDLDDIWAGLLSKSKELQKLDINHTSTQMELCLRNDCQRQNFSYYTGIYLAAPDETIYAKVTTVSPYYIIINESKKTIILEQSEVPASYLQKNPEYLPLILEPGARQAFSFYSFQTAYHGQDEFLHIKVSDERILAPKGSGELRKCYNWSCPF